MKRMQIALIFGDLNNAGDSIDITVCGLLRFPSIESIVLCLKEMGRRRDDVSKLWPRLGLKKLI